MTPEKPPEFTIDPPGRPRPCRLPAAVAPLRPASSPCYD